MRLLGAASPSKVRRSWDCVAEAHHPGSKAAQRPRPFTEHLVVIMAGVRQELW